MTYRYRNLFSRLNAAHLLSCWDHLNKKATAGIDGVDASEYEADLVENVKQLAQAVQGKRYRAKLVLRKWIPKSDGKQRPLGIPTVSDKLLQKAVATILEEIYEPIFLNCSYGYRRGLGAHNAITALTRELQGGCYHYLVEADIKSFFDHIDHDLLMEMLAKRIDDKPFLNLIRKWLKAGILDQGGVIYPERGTPQGGVISSLLANIYLHEVLDSWFYSDVQSHCRGDVYLCRYADDFVCAFEYESDANRFYKALLGRLKRYRLEVAEDKTHIHVFSRLKRRASSAFVFLSFEFRWKLSRFRWGKSRFMSISRRTSPKKLRASLLGLKDWLKRYAGMRKPLLFQRLSRKLRGYYQYYGIQGNSAGLNTFYYRVCRQMFKWINRRSQRRSCIWQGFKEMAAHFKLPKPFICHAF